MVHRYKSCNTIIQYIFIFAFVTFLYYLPANSRSTYLYIKYIYITGIPVNDVIAILYIEIYNKYLVK